MTKREQALRQRLQEAILEAYSAQEKRTVDGDIKKAVWSALQHMNAFVLGEHYDLPKVTLNDIEKMEKAVKIDGPLLRIWQLISKNIIRLPPDLAAELLRILSEAGVAGKKD